MVVDDDDSIVVEEYPIDEVVYEIFSCTFVRFVEVKELLEPKLYLFFSKFLRILELLLDDSFLDEFLVFFKFLKFGLRGLRYNPSLDSREEVVYAWYVSMPRGGDEAPRGRRETPTKDNSF